MSETLKDRIIDLEQMKRRWIEDNGTEFPQEELLRKLKAQAAKKH